MGTAQVIAVDVSVAMCTYNGARFVGEQLRSIFAQSEVPAEIVIVDDRSTDNTVAVVRRTVADLVATSPLYKKVDVRIRQNTDSLGVTANFEKALEATTKELIFLCDQDDLWHTDKVAIQRAQLAAGTSVSFGDARLVDECGEPLGHSLFEALAVRSDELAQVQGTAPMRALIRRNIVTGATMAFRRELLEAARPFPLAWVHDEWLVAVAAIRRLRFGVTEPLVDYRQHGSNQIGVLKRTLTIKLSRLKEPGADRNARLLARAMALSARTTSLGACDEDVSLIAKSLRHQLWRSNYPRNRFCRWVFVVPEILSRRYFLVSNGAQDIVRDVFGPI
jgi:glycosyltransferase involved in cell wall biosynthesis